MSKPEGMFPKIIRNRQIKSHLKDINWNDTFHECDNASEMANVFYSKLNTAIDKFVPKYKIKKSKFPPWYSAPLINALSEKEKFRLKYRKHNNPRDRLTFELLRSRCHTLINKCYSDYKHNIENDISKQPKAFWRFIKDKRRGESCIPAEMFKNDKVVNSGPEVANLFADQFMSVFSPHSSETFNTSNLSPGIDSVISTIKLTEKEILTKLKHIDITKSAGPDSIPPLFIRRCSHEIAIPLLSIFNSSLAEGIYPDVWKKARIVPVYKKGDPADVKNYRPISILSCFAKIFESLICPYITRHIDEGISPNQHGFKAGRSVETNLVNFVTDVTQALDKRLEVDAVYTDFTSAFDKVNHSLLLTKLEFNGVKGSLLNWFASYLSRRSQILVVNGYESYPYFAKSGVPQGSHLAPVLFLLFINDIAKQIHHSKYLIFADDLKIYKNIASDKDVILIQNDLNRIEQWCHLNHMELNVHKCSHIRFSRKKRSNTVTYSIKRIPLQTVHEVRDLGIIMDSKMTFRSHIDNIVMKSARLLGFLKRSTKGFKMIKTKIVLYNAFVRSILEFGSVVWNPHYAVHSQRVEAIQRAFTRHLAYVSGSISPQSPYEERILHFLMNTLRDRRVAKDLIFFHKLVNNKLDCNDLLEQIGLKVPHSLPRYPIVQLFHIKKSNTNIGVNSPINRLCQEVNSFLSSAPDVDIHSITVNKLKTQIQSTQNKRKAT